MTGTNAPSASVGIEVGGRRVVAFITIEEDGELVAIHPLPVDGRDGFGFEPGVTDATDTIEVHGVESSVGERIADRYESGVFPAGEVSWEMIYDD